LIIKISIKHFLSQYNACAAILKDIKQGDLIKGYLIINHCQCNEQTQTYFDGNDYFYLKLSISLW